MEIGRIPNRLKFFRQCSGYSQKKVARILGLSDTSMISRWEHGISLPGIKHVFRLCNLYQVLPHELFDELWDEIVKNYGLLAQPDEPFNSNEAITMNT